VHRVTTRWENLRMSGNLTAVWEITKCQGNLVRKNYIFTSSLGLHQCFVGWFVLPQLMTLPLNGWRHTARKCTQQLEHPSFCPLRLSHHLATTHCCIWCAAVGPVARRYQLLHSRCSAANACSIMLSGDTYWYWSHYSPLSSSITPHSVIPGLKPEYSTNPS